MSETRAVYRLDCDVGGTLPASCQGLGVPGRPRAPGAFVSARSAGSTGTPDVAYWYEEARGVVRQCHDATFMASERGR